MGQGRRCLAPPQRQFSDSKPAFTWVLEIAVRSLSLYPGPLPTQLSPQHLVHMQPLPQF